MSGLMTSVPRRRTRLRGLKTLAMLAVVMLLGACSTQKVVVSGNFPEPLISPMPLTIGVWYDDAFLSHEFFDEASGRAEPSWLVRTGEAQVQMWDKVFKACEGGAP